MSDSSHHTTRTTDGADRTDATGGTERTDDVERTNATVGADGTVGTDEAGAAEPVLELDGVHKRYGSETVIDGMTLSVREGEILTLLGPSGCGKTTTLRLVAGLERPDGGRIALRGETVADGDRFVAPEQRGVGVVFQEFALFPHLTAAENVGFGLADRPADEREARVAELLELVDLEGYGDSYPDELSGGQQQRIALARSLAPEPEILLLDEPFSNLDVDLRVEMRQRVRAILKDAGVTAVSVTHDQEEAMSISDRVAVVSDGAIEQVGPPEQVFQQPESRFVAGFLGHASFLSGYVSGDSVETSVGTVPRDRVHGLAEQYDETPIEVLVRPDDVTARPVGAADGGSGTESEGDGRDGGSGPDSADGRVTHRRYLGPTVLYHVELDNGDVVQCMHNHTEQVPIDAPVDVSVTADHDLAWFPAPQTDGGSVGGASAASGPADASPAGGTTGTSAADPDREAAGGSRATGNGGDSTHSATGEGWRDPRPDAD